MSNLIITTISNFTAELLSDAGKSTEENINQATVLMGEEGLLDSIDLVNLVVTVEQYIEDTYNITITIADEKAMSQKRSPFKTIGSLAEYVELLINETTQQ